MIKILIALALLCISCFVNAHNPDHSSTLLVEQEDNKWILQVRSALTAFEYEIHENYGASSYTTPEEFQELVVEYMRKHISILFNAADQVDLQNGQVKLGHETSLTFEVGNAPKTIESVAVQNSSFRDLPNSQSALMIIKKGFSKNQFVLNKSNNHSAKVQVSNGQFELVTSTTPITVTKNKTQYWLLILVFISIALFVLFFVFKKNKTPNLTELSSQT